MNQKEHSAIIAENILANLRQRKMTQTELAAAIGIAPSTLTDYLKLRILPSHAVIQKMADYFGIEKSDLDTTYKSTTNNLESLIDQADFYKDLKLDKPTRLEIKNILNKFLKTRQS